MEITLLEKLGIINSFILISRKRIFVPDKNPKRFSRRIYSNDELGIDISQELIQSGYN